LEDENTKTKHNLHNVCSIAESVGFVVWQVIHHLVLFQVEGTMIHHLLPVLEGITVGPDQLANVVTDIKCTQKYGCEQQIVVIVGTPSNLYKHL
jgi:hypothetical protein